MAIRYLSGINVDSNTLFVDDANNRVGIGTASPAYKLDVNGNARAGGMTLNAFATGTSGGNLELGFDGTQGVVQAYNRTTPDFIPLYLSGSDFRFNPNGTERVRITSAGNVGIGTTAPARKLDVSTADPIILRSSGTTGYGAGIDFYHSNSYRAFVGFPDASADIGANQLLLYTGSAYPVSIYTNNTERMRITDAGNVGIGTTSPAAKLDVSLGVNTDANQTISRFGANNASGQLKVLDVQYTGGATNLLTLRTNAVGTDPDIAFNVGATEIARFLGAGNVGIGTTAPTWKLQTESSSSTVAMFRSSDSNTIVGIDNSAVDGDPQLKFYINDIGTFTLGVDDSDSDKFKIGTSDLTTNTRLTIDGSGNVGIDTTSPGSYYSSKLVVYAGAENGITIANSGTSGSQYLMFADGTTGNERFRGYVEYAHTGDYMAFATSGTERVRITSGGNVGIGTTSPAYKLQVDGSTGVRNGSFYIGDESGSTNSAVEFYKSGTTIRMYTNTGAFGGTYGATSASLTLYSGSAYSTLINGNGDSYFNAGNVGIGTTAPGAKLDVNGGANTEMRLTTSGSGILQIGQFTNGAYIGTTSSDATAGVLRLGANSAERMRIDVNGNVGIGITSVSARLSIASVNGSNDEKLQRWVYYAPTPTDYYLDLKQTVTSAVVRYNFSMVNAGTAYNDVLVLDRGNVGIGNTDPSQKLHVSGNIRVTGAYYDSSNSAGSSGQVLSSTGSGTAWVNQGEATATSLYDLLPAARVAFNWTGQVVNDTWTTIFSKSDNILTTGTWMVQMYISDFAVGGGHYTYTYTGVMQWYQDTVNQTGEAAFSEIYLHRMGHAANASVLYLRTAESGAAAGNLGYFQIKGNYSNTSNTTINFKFVKIF